MTERSSSPRNRIVITPNDVPAEGPCFMCDTCAGPFVRKVLAGRDRTVCLDASGCSVRIVMGGGL